MNYEDYKRLEYLRANINDYLYYGYGLKTLYANNHNMGYELEFVKKIWQEQIEKMEVM